MNRSLDRLRLPVISVMLLLMLVGIVWRGVVEFRQVVEATHADLLGRTVGFVVDDILSDLLTNAEKIASGLKKTNKLPAMIRAKELDQREELLVLLRDQFRQRSVTSGEIKLLSISVFDLRLDKIFSVREGDDSESVLSGVVRHALLSRRNSERYQTLPLFWKDGDGQLLYSIFFPIGGLAIKGYLVVTVDPVFALSKIHRVLGMPAKLHDGSNGLYQSEGWSLDVHNGHLLLVDFPVLKDVSGDPIFVSILNDFSSVSRTILNGLVIGGSALLCICGLAIFLATHVVRRSQLEALSLAAEVAEKSTHAKGRFLANMSHEIRTPINAIVGFTHLLQQTTLSSEQSESVDRVDMAAQSLCSLVNDVLDFSKIEEEKLELENIPFNLYDEVMKVRSLFSLKISEKNIDLLIQVSPDLPEGLIGDPLRVNQVLTNLTGNAVKFVRHGSITISVLWKSQSPKEGTVEISVKDTGVGISEKNISGIFKSFSQEDNTTTRKFGGTGLGLTISKQIVQLMGGDLVVHSVLGEGSVFTFTIPLCVEDAVPVGNACAELSGKEVLLIESSPSIAGFVHANLDSINVETTYYPTSDDALVILGQYSEVHYAFAIVEWKNSHKPCSELVEVLRDNLIAKNLILLIDHTMVSDVDLFRSMGVRACLQKPMSSIELRYSLSQVLAGVNLLNAKEEADKKKIKSYRGKQCLVVDDNESNIVLLVKLLQSYEIEVVSAINGRDALTKIEASIDREGESTFDLVLMDMMMPVMDGYEAVTRLREDTRFDKLFIVALTANATLEEKQRCIGLGSNGYLTKPLHIDALEDLFGERFGEPVLLEPECPLEVLSEHKSYDEFPEMLPGVNIDAALKMLGGKKQLYQYVAQSFSQEYENFQQKFTQTLLSADPDDAVRMVHGLKGLAGSLGATELQSAAFAVEQKLMAQQDVDDMLPSLYFALPPVLSACEQVQNFS
ncbi:hypothetical protein A9Q99_00930 [Gammaproteobacteria bacterium 45_16_T64]|nr:hypothetical protein A9Q99_00930 [Gammaproteobacteria bacterium 45_16_T64]